MIKIVNYFPKYGNGCELFLRERDSFGLLFMIDINMENMENENETRIFLYKSERNIEREKFKLLDLRN